MAVDGMAVDVDPEFGIRSLKLSTALGGVNPGDIGSPLRLNLIHIRCAVDVLSFGVDTMWRTELLESGVSLVYRGGLLIDWALIQAGEEI